MSIRYSIKKIYVDLLQVLGKPWMQYLWLFIITLLAAALRFYKLGEWSFWIDEIYTVNHASAHFSSMELILENIPPARNWIPISVILTAQVMNIFGVNELNARLIAAVIGIFTIPVFYFFIKKIFNIRVALISVLLLAVSPWHLEWSQNARGYTSLMLFYWLSLFALYFGVEKDRPFYFLFFFLFLYLASSERLIALFILPVIFIYLLILSFPTFEKPPGLRGRNILIILSPAILFGLYTLYDSIQNGDSMIGSIVSEIVNTFFGKPIESSFTQTIFLIFAIGIPVIVFSLFSGVYVWLQRDRHGLLFLVGAFVPFVLVAIITPFMFTEERYAFVTLPGWLVLVALGIEELFKRLKQKQKIFAAGILFVFITASLSVNLLYYHNNHGNRRDWKSAFEIVQENIKEGDVVVSTWPVLGNYYLKQEDVLLWQDTNVEYVKNNNKRIWFVVIPDMAWFSGTEDFYWWVSHNTRLIKTLYLRTVDNANLEIYVFDPEIDLPLIKTE